jgi:2-haloacid dehalogenase
MFKKVLSFDCYGTLVDWESGISKFLTAWLEKNNHKDSPDQILKLFGQYESEIQKQFPSDNYQNILAKVFNKFCDHYQIKSQKSDEENFAKSPGEWPLFGDTIESLQVLSKKFKLVILSNIDNKSIQKTVEKIGAEFAEIFTAEDIGTFKPSTNNFQYMLQKLEAKGFKKDEILHCSVSIYHDHIPAKSLGIDTCLITRANSNICSQLSENEKIYDLKFNDLKGLKDFLLNDDSYYNWYLEKTIEHNFEAHPFSKIDENSNLKEIFKSYYEMSFAFPYLQAVSLGAFLKHEISNHKKAILARTALYLTNDEFGIHGKFKRGMSDPKSLINIDYDHATLFLKDVGMTAEECKSNHKATKKYLDELGAKLSSENLLEIVAMMIAFEYHADNMIRALYGSLKKVKFQSPYRYFDLHVGDEDPAEDVHKMVTANLINEFVNENNKEEFLLYLVKGYGLNHEWGNSLM